MTPKGVDRLSDEVPHVYVTAEGIPLTPDVTIPAWLARKHRLVTNKMIAQKYGLTVGAIFHWTRARDFPCIVALLDSEGKPHSAQNLYPADAVDAWVKNYRPNRVKE
jgi:hypothetical protein